jgi:hypothetical protein
VLSTVLVLIVSACGRSHPFIGKWRPPSSRNCDYRLEKIELTETTVIVMVHVGFNGGLDSHTTAVTYSRDGEFYLATPTAGNERPLKFRLNRPNIELDSGCIFSECWISCDWISLNSSGWDHDRRINGTNPR